MHFAFTEEQRLLQDSVAKLVENDYPFETRRKRAASEDGFSRGAWAKLAELGWLGLGIDEADGGYGGGAVETSIVLEGLGAALAVEPYLSTVVLGGTLLTRGASGEPRALLPRLAAGKLQLAFAFAERQSRYNLADVETRATRSGSGFRIDGAKSVVLHAATADEIAVTARTGGGVRERSGLSVFLLARGTPGLSVRGYRTVDGLRAGEVRLEGVEVAADRRLGGADEGYALVERVIDAGIVGIAAEAVGIMRHMHGATLEHLRNRQQFGQSLASFQALQHRLVDMYVAYELSRSMAYMAAVKLATADDDERRRAVSATKVSIGEAGRLIGQESIQLHGGMGMTDEMAISHYFKRMTMINSTFGDEDHHLEIVAGTVEE